jgi:hypothetical protein
LLKSTMMSNRSAGCTSSLARFATGASRRLPLSVIWVNGLLVPPDLSTRLKKRAWLPLRTRKRYLRRLTVKNGWILPLTVTLSPRWPSVSNESKVSWPVLGLNSLSARTSGTSWGPLGSRQPAALVSSPVSFSSNSRTMLTRPL